MHWCVQTDRLFRVVIIIHPRARTQAGQPRSGTTPDDLSEEGRFFLAAHLDSRRDANCQGHSPATTTASECTSGDRLVGLVESFQGISWRPLESWSPTNERGASGLRFWKGFSTPFVSTRVDTS